MNTGVLSRSNRLPEIGYITPAGVLPLVKTRPVTYKRIAHNDVPHRPQRSVEIPENLILRSLPAETLRTLEPFLKPVFLTKQQYLFHEDDRLDFVYFPGTAVVSEFRMLEDGRMVEIAVTGRDGAIGLTSLLLGSHSASNITQVSQAGTARRIDFETFAASLRSSEHLRTGLNRFIDLYIRQISQKAICNMYHSVKQRLCTWLLMAEDRCGLNMLNLTHEQISRILGVYRPSVTCMAQELRKSKLINYSRAGISICDRKRVEESACACYLAPEWAATN